MENQPIKDPKEAQNQDQVQPERQFPKHVDFLTKWVQFSTYNQFIEGVNIIAFKCPLKEEFNEHLKKEEFFPFKDVYDYSVKMDKPITDVIDLTFTTKYYNPKENDFFPEGVKHHKFMIPGKEVPKPELVEPVMNVMDEAIKKGGVIGIHCTHGINRTGHIVCSFLVSKLGWEPEKAIAAFGLARSHDMEYEEYKAAVLALKKKPEENKSGEEKGKIEGKVTDKEESNIVDSDL